jgi:ankyrin repeat protein
VRRLLEEGVDINSKDKYGGTPLLQAAVNGHEALVRLLLEKGADVNAGNALEAESTWHYDKIVELLVLAGGRSSDIKG